MRIFFIPFLFYDTNYYSICGNKEECDKAAGNAKKVMIS